MAIWLDQSAGSNREGYGKAEINPCFIMRNIIWKSVWNYLDNILNTTQKDLSAKTGITQADISRIENGTRNPSLSMVKKLAHGLGMQLKLEFVPMPTKNKM